MRNVKLAFVKDVLSQEGQKLQQAIIKSITSEGLKDPSLSISSRVLQHGEVSSFELTLPLLRRFQDMGAPLHKNKNLLSENVLTNSEFYKPKKRRKYPVYNKNVWGHLNSFSKALMYGMTKEVITSLKKQVQ